MERRSVADGNLLDTNHEVLINLLTQKTNERLGTTKPQATNNATRTSSHVKQSSSTLRSNAVAKSHRSSHDRGVKPKSMRLSSNCTLRTHSTFQKFELHEEEFDSPVVHLSWQLSSLVSWLTSSQVNEEEEEEEQQFIDSYLEICSCIEVNKDFETARVLLRKWCNYSNNNGNESSDKMHIILCECLGSVVDATIEYCCGRFELAIDKFVDAKNKLLVHRYSAVFLEGGWSRCYSCVAQGLVSSDIMAHMYIRAFLNLWRHLWYLPVSFVSFDLYLVLLSSISARHLLGGGLSVLSFIVAILFLRSSKVKFRKGSSENCQKVIPGISPIKHLGKVFEAPRLTGACKPDVFNIASLYANAVQRQKGESHVSRGFMLPRDSLIDGESAVFGQRVVLQPLLQHQILDIFQPARDYQSIAHSPESSVSPD